MTGSPGGQDSRPARQIPRASSARDEILRLASRARVVFTDIDETLVGRDGNLLADSAGRPSIEVASAIADLAGNGIELVLISGRRSAQVAPIAGAIGASGYIAEMGTQVVIEVRSGTHHANEVIRPLGEYPFGDEHPYDAMLRTGAVDLVLRRNPGTVEFHAPWHDERETSHLLRGELDLQAENAALEAAGHGWCEIVDNGVIPDEYPGLDIDVVRAYQIIPKGTGKEYGVKVWLAGRGLDAGEAVALGDARGDLPLAGTVAVFFLMLNGYEADPSIAADAARYPNVYLTDRANGPGWASAVRLAITAVSGAN